MTLMTNDLNDHFFLEEGGREKRKTVGGREKRKPVGRREKRNPVGVPADLKSADKKGSTYFFADLKSASSEVAFLPPVLLADYKSAIVTHTAADCKSAETEGDRREKRERLELENLGTSAGYGYLPVAQARYRELQRARQGIYNLQPGFARLGILHHTGTHIFLQRFRQTEHG